MNKKKVYLAGPEVFLTDAIEIGKKKKDLCSAYGLEGLFPFDNEIEDAPGQKVDFIIYKANKVMMREADFGIFNLTPFRGPSADVGTIFELGLMTGMGKPCFGYSNDSRDFLDRVTEFQTLLQGVATNPYAPESDMSIENFGNADNLMIDGALFEGGFQMVRQSRSGDETYRSLDGFEQCLKFIKQLLVIQDHKAKMRA